MVPIVSTPISLRRGSGHAFLSRVAGEDDGGGFERSEAVERFELLELLTLQCKK
jgi:hypothetical protein